MATRKCWGEWIIVGGCRRWGVVTARWFILSKVNAPRSTASSRRGNATANKGEQGTRQLWLVRCPRQSARCSHDGKWLSRFGISVRATMQKIVYFFGESAWRRKREIHPADAIIGTGRVGRGRWKGGGVLLALGTASCLVEDTTCQRDGNVIIVTSFLVAGGSIFNLWVRQTPSFFDLVARASDTPMRLRHQNRERNSASWQKISHRGQYRLRWCSTKLAREGGGRCFGSQVSSIRKL